MSADSEHQVINKALKAQKVIYDFQDFSIWGRETQFSDQYARKVKKEMCLATAETTQYLT